jgi:hypothetical protein
MRDLGAGASQTSTTSRQWQQIALQLELLGPVSETDATSADNPSYAVQDALVAADHARDALAQRDVLARIYTHLAEQALARGRAPVPKAQGRKDSPGVAS